MPHPWRRKLGQGLLYAGLLGLAALSSGGAAARAVLPSGSARLARMAPAAAPPRDAAERPRVAVTERALWPYPLGSARGFDTASRAEIALFVAALAADDRRAAPPAASVEAWKRRARANLVAGFAAACRTCSAPADLLCPAAPPSAWEPLAAFAAAGLTRLPPELSAWKREAAAFHRTYLRERLRLAVLFPRVTSEILPLASSDRLGDELPDKAFLLSFDDGPTAPGGSTDQTLALVRAQGIHAVFFLLGTAVEPRRAGSSDGALRDLYAGMCVGSHGQEHRSHARWPGAAAALAGFDARLAALLPAGQPRLLLFRPPYGERSAELLAALATAGLTELLWNIDSQDWQAALGPRPVAGRVLTLMLLERRGILLFHDVHPKALGALPTIWQATAGSGVHWMDCRDLR